MQRLLQSPGQKWSISLNSTLPTIGREVGRKNLLNMQSPSKDINYLYATNSPTIRSVQSIRKRFQRLSNSLFPSNLRVSQVSTETKDKRLARSVRGIITWVVPDEKKVALFEDKGVERCGPQYLARKSHEGEEKVLFLRLSRVVIHSCKNRSNYSANAQGGLLLSARIRLGWCIDQRRYTVTRGIFPPVQVVALQFVRNYDFVPGRCAITVVPRLFHSYLGQTDGFSIGTFFSPPFFGLI